MGSLRQLRANCNFEITSFIEDYLTVKDFGFLKREEYKGWIRLTYQHNIRKLQIRVDIFFSTNFHISCDINNPFNPTPLSAGGDPKSKTAVVKALKQILLYLGINN